MESINRHPGFNYTTLDNDIAILTLVTALTYNSYVNPIDLSDSCTVATGTLVRVSGWGATEQGGSSSASL